MARHWRDRPVMQHRHFAKIASIIATLPVTDLARADIARHFASQLKASNEVFDRGRFIDAATGNPVNGSDAP